MLMTTLTTECPSPGVYEGVSFDEYNGWRAISNTALSLLAKSPRHYRDGERSEQTADMRIGELCHVGVFEPAAVAERYEFLPAFERDPENCTGKGESSESKSTKYYKAKRAAFEAEHVGKEIVPREIFESVMTLVHELSENAQASALLNGPGPVECSLIWDEEINGTVIRCKARLDKIALDHGAIVDLKKCRDVLAFEKDIAYRSYDRQLAHYQAGWAALHDGECLTPWLIAHEMTVPLTVLAAPLADETLIDGFTRRQQLLERLAECIVTDHWPGPENPREWSKPGYSFAPVTMFANGEKVEV